MKTRNLLSFEKLNTVRASPAAIFPVLERVHRAYPMFHVYPVVTLTTLQDWVVTDTRIK